MSAVEQSRAAALSLVFGVAAPRVVVRSRRSHPRSHAFGLVNPYKPISALLARREGASDFTARYKYSWHMFYFKVAVSD